MAHKDISEKIIVLIAWVNSCFHPKMIIIHYTC